MAARAIAATPTRANRYGGGSWVTLKMSKPIAPPPSLRQRSRARGCLNASRASWDEHAHGPDAEGRGCDGNQDEEGIPGQVPFLHDAPDVRDDQEAEDGSSDSDVGSHPWACVRRSGWAL